MPKRVAIIDLGTNTFHLLIAEIEKEAKVVLRERAAVKIGKGGINNRQITADAMARAVEALRMFKNSMDRLQVSATWAVGTSAIRNASNGRELVDEIARSTGIQTRIIDGDEEAELIYEGIRFAIDLGSRPSLIIDIGGGSVEFIIANANEVFWKRSFEIGAQRLLELYQKHDPILPGEIAELDEVFQTALAPLKDQLKIFDPKILVGSSGTFDTLSEMYCLQKGMPFYPEDKETPLTFGSFYESYELIISRDRSGRLAIPGMIEMRVDMIVVACCLVRYLLEAHRFDEIRVSSYSLKEGILAKLVSATAARQV